MPSVTEPTTGLFLRAFRGFGHGMLRLPRPLRGLLVLLWMAGIWYLSSQEDLLPEGADSVLWSFAANLAHAPLFGLLAMWTGLAWLPSSSATHGRAAALPALGVQGIGVGFLLSLAYGLMDEWHQSWVPGRHAGLGDVMTDALGAVSVLACASLLAQPATTEGKLRRNLLWSSLVCSLSALAMSL